jgi:hypothetical protein
MIGTRMMANSSPPNHRGEAARHRLQEGVADRVAECVVDRLELVEVQIQERHPATVAGMRERTLELLVQEQPVGQPGQRVMAREVGDPGLRAVGFRDVVVGGEPARRHGLVRDLQYRAF